MNLIFSEFFVDSLSKYSSLKHIVRKKVDMIAENPIALGEPLKGILRGYYSCPVKKNFLILYLYCKICRVKGDDEIVLCHDCMNCEDETIKFVALGPHDNAYKKKPKC